MKDWIAKLLEDPDLTRMGHLQRIADLNLGLGWLYYGFARTIRPAKVVVIGSYRGFVPLVLGKALSDNQEGGQVVFIDPSLVDEFWKDPQAVRDHFARYGVANVQHHLMTTQEFAASAAYRSLDRIGMVFVDGYHTEEQARFDYETFEALLQPDGLALFHDTANRRFTKIYGPERSYQCRVKFYIDKLKLDPCLQIFDLPFGDGVTLVRKLQPEQNEPAVAFSGSEKTNPRQPVQ